MNHSRNSLSAICAASTGIPEFKCRKAFDALLDALTQAAIAGKTVELRGVATFYPNTTAERKARNLLTGETVRIPESRTLKARFSPAIRNNCRKTK